ncbi:MAG TPA: hypothetical protein VLC98_03665 [Phnomibacter sp.]|nr:hypothetical protein [Phnomibacter sp.]
MKTLLTIFIVGQSLLGFTQESLFFFRKGTKVNKILVLPPATLIYGIFHGSKLQFDSVLTQKAFLHTSTQLIQSFPDSISTVLFSADSVNKLKLRNFVCNLNNEFKKESQIKKYQLPDSILILFDTTKFNYVFCTSNVGFIRDRNNLTNTAFTMEITNMLTGHGLRPAESASVMSCFIIDLRKKNILCFQRSIWMERDPTDLRIIKLQLARLIKQIFFWQNQY